MKKGQIIMWDLIFGAMIFLVAYAMTANLWETTYADLRHAEDEYEMAWLAETVSEQLVRTAGDPQNWSSVNVVSYGLADSDPALKKVTGRILDPDKILNLVGSFQKNYTNVRDNLLGSGKYELYIELSCTNSTKMACLQGLPLDSVWQSVSCENQDIHVSNHRTDNYYFLEAEGLWGDPTNVSCSKGCSKGNMSKVHLKEPATVKVDPGMYRIWVRPFEDNYDTMFLVNDREYPLYVTGIPGQTNWNLMGEQELEFDTRLGFRNTRDGTQVDAILLTTDMTYDPRYSNQEMFGDPNLGDKCLLGRMREGADIISSSKNGVVNLPKTLLETFKGTYQTNSKVLDINVVLYQGIALPPRDAPSTTSTTTTLPSWFDLECVGPQPENCSANQRNWIDIYDAKLFDPSGAENNIITCGAMKNISVYWQGSHAGDPNFYGFFVENETSFLGSCRSDVPAGGESAFNYYKMNCNVTADSSTLAIPDGIYDLVITGEDMLGYCNPTDSRKDEEYRTSVVLKNCVSYTDITCGGDPGFVPGCSATDDRVEAIIDVEGPSNINCNQPYTYTVYFKGRRNDNGNIRWAFVIEDTPGHFLCVSKCRYSDPPPPAIEAEGQYYRMTCTVDLNLATCGNTANYELEDGDYNMYIVAETAIAGRYCTIPSQGDAYKLKPMTLNNCKYT